MMRLRHVLPLALVVGLVAGTLEAAFIEALSRTDPSPQGSGHVIWMVPLADALFVVSCSMASYACGRWISVLRRPRVVDAVAWAGAAFALLLVIPYVHPLASGLLAVGLGSMRYRWSARARDAGRPLRSGVIVLAAGILALVLLARMPGPPLGPGGPGSTVLDERTRSASPNVLLIILDTVRAKSLGLYGYERETTTHLARWAEDGAVFERAIAPAPWTLPSHASMFTGQPPSRLSTHFRTRLDDTYPTLAEELSAHGYATAGFVANVLYASRFSGLARGFGEYDDFPVSFGQMLLGVGWGRRLADWDWLRNGLGAEELLNRRSAASIVDRFLAWREELRASEDRPFFAFLNLFDAHEPYLPPAPFDRRFAAGGSRGKLLHHVSIRAGNEAIRPRKWEMNEADRELDLALYEGAIAYMDAELERLFEALDGNGELDETLIIVASDHGEQFGEHGLYRHTNSLYMPALHVLLFVRHPGTVPEGVRVRVPVSLRQIPATVMDLLGLRATAEFPGPSLARAWSDGVAPPPFSELELGAVRYDWYPIARGRLRSLVSGSLHYIRDESGGEELYDLGLDPDESVDLSADPGHTVELQALRARMDSMLATDPEPSNVPD